MPQCSHFLTCLCPDWPILCLILILLSDVKSLSLRPFPACPCAPTSVLHTLLGTSQKPRLPGLCFKAAVIGTRWEGCGDAVWTFFISALLIFFIPTHANPQCFFIKEPCGKKNCSRREFNVMASLEKKIGERSTSQGHRPAPYMFGKLILEIVYLDYKWKLLTNNNVFF